MPGSHLYGTIETLRNNMTGSSPHVNKYPGYGNRDEDDIVITTLLDHEQSKNSVDDNDKARSERRLHWHWHDHAEISEDCHESPNDATDTVE